MGSVARVHEAVIQSVSSWLGYFVSFAVLLLLLPLLLILSSYFLLRFKLESQMCVCLNGSAWLRLVTRDISHGTLTHTHTRIR